MTASEEMTRSAIAIQASFRRRHVHIRARAQERGKALAQEQHAKRADPTNFDAKLAAFQGVAANQAVNHRIDFANAANGNPRPTSKHSSDAGNHDGDASSTSRTNVLRRPRATTRFGADASAAAPAPTSTAASATAVSKLLQDSEARPLQTLQEGAEVLASATLNPVARHTTTAANIAAIGSAAAGATQEELRRSYASEHAISVSEPESRMARKLAEVEAAVTKQRGLASERDAEHGWHTQEQAQAMKADREKLETERAQMAEQLAKLHEQSRRELTAWGDAQAADKGRLDALAAQLEGLRNERAALSMEREAMAQERKKLQKIRRQQEQQQQANRGAENTEKIPASVVQKRMQRQWAAQCQAFERLERLLQDATVKPPRRGSAAAAPGRIDGVKTDVSVPTSHSRRRRRRQKRNRCKDVSGASITAGDAASGGGSTGKGLRWRRVPLRRTVPPAMLFSPTSPCLQQGRACDRSSDNVSSSVRPTSDRADSKRRTSAGAFPEPEDFALRCARRAAAIQARLEGFDAATF